MINVLID